jgi:hypothetical protein
VRGANEIVQQVNRLNDPRTLCKSLFLLRVALFSTAPFLNNLTVVPRLIFPIVKRASPGFGRAENVVGFLSLDFIAEFLICSIKCIALIF